ncbi:hypothetical protein ABFS83_04G221400 [Erythranthe nasuta]
MAPPENKPTPPRHVVAMPYPGRGHINPMLNLCKAVAERSGGSIHITIVLTEEWVGLIGGMAKPPNISFAAIPNVVPSESVRADDVNGFAMAVQSKMGEPFERLLDELRAPPPDFIVADAFLPWAGEAAGRRNIPVAYLWTMSAAVYTMLIHYQLLAQNGHFPVDLSVNGDGIVDYIPGLSPIRAADLPLVLRDKEIITMLEKALPHHTEYSKHLVFSSIHHLESKVFEALNQESPFSIFNIGPTTSYQTLKNILNNNNQTPNDETNNNVNSYLEWLNDQPPRSVLYVSLGSFLTVSSAQLDEIASGLCGSGVRFLWVARRETQRLQEICGGGGEKGVVVEWCDQLRVLSHPSVGGFWSHCGWSSTKEAVMAGVAVLASPIIMDQLPNAKAVVEDWKIGWRVIEREFDEENLVKRDEISELVQRFMDLDCPERAELTKNVENLKKACESEFESGGSFETNLDGFVEFILS